MWFEKVGYSNAKVVTVSKDVALASKSILERLNKFAQGAKVLAPKSDDFLYFTIIFMKAAESSLIDSEGNLKKLANGERAWGYFNKDWRWQGNVPFHKNANRDAFSEIELKKAAKGWVGCPLAVDHRADSVDGIRGIILDTYYDEKHKQVVGLCALDKVNYPILARKVQTGVVRYGSMGTAVELAVCSDCGRKARTQNDFCVHMASKSAYAEINVGLKPIEYSLVVQPAEPGAKLLQCLASIEEHKSELENYGVTDFEKLSNNISLEQAEGLDQILKAACKDNGCSLEKRASLIRNYISENKIITAQDNILEPSQSREVQFAKALSQLRDAGASENDVKALYESFDKLYQNESMSQSSLPEGEVFTSGANSEGRAAIETHDSEGVRGNGTESTGTIASESVPSSERANVFDADGVGPESYLFADVKSIMGEIMKDSKLRERSELRRRLAYFYGGAASEGQKEPVEPSDYKHEGVEKHRSLEKARFPDKSMGGDSGMMPGDKELKESVKRAKEAETRLQRRAYFYGGAASGGAEPVEPPTYKSEDYKKYWSQEKSRFPDKSMGGDSGMMPGDKELKERLKRAKLSTKFKQVRTLNGQVNKAASAFEVYVDGKLAIATTAREIFGPSLGKNWDFLSSKDYGKLIVSAIREDGYNTVAKNLTRTAQELEGLGDAALEESPMEDAPPMDDAAPMEMEEEAPMDEAGEEDPSDRVDSALVAMESAISDIRSAVEELGGTGGDVEINVETGGNPEVDAEKVSLSRQLLTDLRKVLAESNESADELALLSEAFEKRKTLSAKKVSELRSIASDALSDSAQLTGEANTLIRMARTFVASSVKTAEYVEEEAPMEEVEMAVDECLADDAEASEYAAMTNHVDEEEEMEQSAEDNQLFAQALSVRKARRLALIETARKKLAEQSETIVSEVSDEEVEEAAEEAAEEEVEEHEEKMHNDSDDTSCAQPLDAVQKSPSLHKDPSGKQASSRLMDRFNAKKAEEEKENVKLRVRRAYDLAIEMQRKGFIGQTKVALDKQIDLILDFDDKAFEAMKSSVAYAKGAETVKTASDLGGLNIGADEVDTTPKGVSDRELLVKQLSALFT